VTVQTAILQSNDRWDRNDLKSCLLPTHNWTVDRLICPIAVYQLWRRSMNLTGRSMISQGSDPYG